jgi:hypothetical protein
MIRLASATEGWDSPPFTSPESLALMWEFVRYFFSAYMPMIMIVVAFFLVVGFLAVIMSLFIKDDKPDDDEVEYL